MLAIGCLLPFGLMIIGGALGAWLGETQSGLFWGGGAGFAAGALAMVVMLWGWERIRRF